MFQPCDQAFWHINAAHYLESWGDARAYDGAASIVQPLIAPLYEGKTAHEILALFSDNYDRKPYEMVREYWRANPPAAPAAAVKSPITMPGVSKENDVVLTTSPPTSSSSIRFSFSTPTIA